MKGKRVMVTGGAGFIGSHMCEKLLKTGNSVICVDNLSTGSMSNIQQLQGKQFRFIKADVRKIDELRKVFAGEKFDYIFHYAATVGVMRTQENPLEVLSDIDGNKCVLQLAKEYGAGKVVFASSSEVYGSPVEIPEVEDGHVNPKMPYAMVKLITEQFCRVYYETYGLKTASLRFFNVYGPRQEATPYGFAVGIFIKQVLRGEPPTVFGDGLQTRDFVFIDDNTELSIMAAESGRTDGEVLNIGTGRPTTILDLAELIIELCGRKGELSPQFLPERKNEIRHRFPDISKMVRLLGQRARYRLEDGLKETIADYKKRL